MYSVVLAIIRSFGYKKDVKSAMELMRSSLDTLPTTSPQSSSQIKLFTVGIEMNLHNNLYQEALDLLHEMVTVTNGTEAVPRSCYMLLFSRFSSISPETTTSVAASTKEEKKTLLDDMYECD